jgi:glycosyltransferase involved in cell wall biosynthesis
MTLVQPPLVSVVCVTYRQEGFAREAVRSVLAQTYPMLDIIILDDASPDDTGEVIAAELAKHRDRIDVRFIRNETNLGFFANARKGLSLAQGDFIVLFCGDDVMQPRMVERMVEVWREADVSLVTANACYIDEAGQKLNRFFRDPTQPYDDTFETLARHCRNAVCFGVAMGFERQLYEEFGFPPDHLTSEDIMLPFYAYLAKGARFIPEPLVQYRVHAHNSSLSLKWERSTPIDRLGVEFEMVFDALAHSVEMAAELERRRTADPARFGDIARRIQPLLTEQTYDWARKLVDTRIELGKFGVTRLIPLSIATESQPA